MFTGIIKEIGVVRNFDKGREASLLKVHAGLLAKDISMGDSVAVNGVCLTVVKFNGDELSFNVMDETVKRTNLSSLVPGEKVNLEGAMPADGKFGGHFVLGHIDCAGRITGIEKSGADVSMTVSFPAEFSKLLVEKGSIAIDGISLTVGSVTGETFCVNLIPHTLKVTTLGMKKKGGKVNLEFDILGKYAFKAQDVTGKSEITSAFLQDKGFT